jgi:S-formylglutathione hydrolase FrmB
VPALVLVLLLLVALAAPAAAVTVETPYCTPRSAPPRAGLELVASAPLGERSVELTVTSSAMERQEKLVVTLPRGYDPSGATRYPVLYLLHGAFGSQRDYVEHGIEAMLGDRQWVVVSPNGGASGSYTDWYGRVRGDGGPAPAWETHVLDEVLPFVQARYPVRADRGGRAIMGISMGGAGTMKFAAARPDLFGAAVSLSGAVNTTYDFPFYPGISQAVWLLTLAPGAGPPAHCTWGDPVANQVIWRDNDPTYLAENLRGVDLRIVSGDGNPGPLDPPGAGFDPVEWQTNAMSLAFAAALDAEGVPHTDRFYGAGTHTWPYWERELPTSLAWLDERLGRDAAAPASFDLRSARGPFGAHGWRFVPKRATREFTYVDDVTAGGFTVAGSGTLDVTTPDGRRLAVDLGPSHQANQTEFPAEAPAGWTRKTVRTTP